MEPRVNRLRTDAGRFIAKKKGILPEFFSPKPGMG
jgi:hypothetical protein